MAEQSVDTILKSALESLAPVWNSVKEEQDEVQETYYVISYSTYGRNHADDEPTAELYMIQVHLFAPLTTNITSLIKQTKQALHGAGFIWPQTVNASDESGRHIVFETEYATGVDL